MVRLSSPSGLVLASSREGGGRKLHVYIHTLQASAEVVCVTVPSAKASHAFPPDS